jgi:hypothetical protein
MESDNKGFPSDIAIHAIRITTTPSDPKKMSDGTFRKNNLENYLVSTRTPPNALIRKGIGTP